MRFAIVTTSISALLVVVVSAISITVLSWIYPAVQNYDANTDSKTEMQWGQGS
jgi:hypothetical protein